MNPIVRNVLAVISGWLTGSIVNLGLIKIGHSLMPIEGLDPNDMDQLTKVMPTADAKYFIFPFLAHALGTLMGASSAGYIAKSHKKKFAMGMGFLFLIGGILASLMIPAPTWFVVIDLGLAYIPMAWLGWKIVARKF